MPRILPAGFVAPCQPTSVRVLPVGPEWLHEIKHDGFRLMVRRTLEGVRIKTRRGFDWTGRFALIIEAAERLGATSFGLDGEGVLGHDLSGTPAGRGLASRSKLLAKLLRRWLDGIQAA